MAVRRIDRNYIHTGIGQSLRPGEHIHGHPHGSPNSQPAPLVLAGIGVLDFFHNILNRDHPL